VLSCSDSRVSPELIFDQTLGELFVIRVAGNVLDDDTLGSIEYAIEHFHSSLIVVMGHENCGAIKAAINNELQKGHIPAIMEKIYPAFQKVKHNKPNQENWEYGTNIENVRNGVKTLLTNPIFQIRVSSGQLKVLGAEYHLASGLVEWVD
jgi:carbonic anhydrase